MSGSRSRRPRSPLRTYGLAFLGSGLVGGLGGAVVGFTGAVGLPGALLIGIGATLALAAILGLSIWWWRQIDEAAQEAHKWAWWWGGSGGMGVGMVLMGLGFHGLENGWLDPALFGREPAEILYRGIMSMLACQLAGYFLAWAAWWLRHR